MGFGIGSRFKKLRDKVVVSSKHRPFKKQILDNYEKLSLNMTLFKKNIIEPKYDSFRQWRKKRKRRLSPYRKISHYAAKINENKWKIIGGTGFLASAAFAGFMWYNSHNIKSVDIPRQKTIVSLLQDEKANRLSYFQAVESQRINLISSQRKDLLDKLSRLEEPDSYHRLNKGEYIEGIARQYEGDNWLQGVRVLCDNLKKDFPYGSKWVNTDGSPVMRPDPKNPNYLAFKKDGETNDVFVGNLPSIKDEIQRYSREKSDLKAEIDLLDKSLQAKNTPDISSLEQRLLGAEKELGQIEDTVGNYDMKKNVGLGAMGLSLLAFMYGAGKSYLGRRKAGKKAKRSVVINNTDEKIEDLRDEDIMNDLEDLDGIEYLRDEDIIYDAETVPLRPSDAEKKPGLSFSGQSPGMAKEGLGQKGTGSYDKNHYKGPGAVGHSLLSFVYGLGKRFFRKQKRSQGVKEEGSPGLGMTPTAYGVPEKYESAIDRVGEDLEIIDLEGYEVIGDRDETLEDLALDIELEEQDRLHDGLPVFKQQSPKSTIDSVVKASTGENAYHGTSEDVIQDAIIRDDGKGKGKRNKNFEFYLTRYNSASSEKEKLDAVKDAYINSLDTPVYKIEEKMGVNVYDVLRDLGVKKRRRDIMQKDLKKRREKVYNLYQSGNNTYSDIAKKIKVSKTTVGRDLKEARKSHGPPEA